MLIYIVEDDANIRQMESYALTNSGLETLELESGTEFFAACGERTPDLVVLDIMLPGESGYEILAKLRASARLCKVPVVMVTARTSEIDAVRGLDAGSDDYITKPFGIMEFLSRVKAVLRRSGAEQNGSVRVGGIALDDSRRTVLADGQACELTYKEYELLKYLMLNENIVLSRDVIMDRVWGTDYEGESRTVDMHIKTLRQKLHECGAQIKTVRNVGYKIEA